MALSAGNLADVQERSGNTCEMQIHPGSVIFNQALVGTVTLSATGSMTQVEPWDGTNANMQFLGVARLRPKEQDDVTGDSVTGVSITGAPSVGVQTSVEVDISGVILKGTTLTSASHQATVGRLVYSSDDDPSTFTTVAPASGADAIGMLLKINSDGTGDVKLFTPGEHAGRPISS